MTLPKLSLMQGILVRAELAARLEEAAAAPAPAPGVEIAEVHARIAKLEAELAAAPGAAPVNDVPPNAPEYASTREAAALLGISPRTLEGLRLRGEGPPHIRIGRRVLYPLASLRSAGK